MLAGALALLAASAVPAVAAGPPGGLPASGWIVVDGRSGQTLAARAPHEARPIASATKLMTYLVAIRKLDPRETVTTAPYTASALESVVGFAAGEKVRVRDLLIGLLLASGNDAAASLAERSAPSTGEFVARMNAAAERLGLKTTTFADPSGLDAANAASPRDLVHLAMELRRSPLFRRIVATRTATVRVGAERFRLINRNRLVRETRFVDGVKTGSTLEAGYVLVASARRGEVELLSAVVGAPGEDSRDDATLALLEYGFSLYRERALVRRGEGIGSVPLAGGSRLPVVASRTVRAVARRDQRPAIRLTGAPSPELPIVTGQGIAKASVFVEGRRVGTVKALASKSISEPADPGASMPGWILGAVALSVLALLSVGGVAVLRSRGGGR